ncbi:hypothetical protein [Micromonospora parathelypteridis]|uniref:Uncharacterized protein n=1 Tax=Micromonospora parathelypteridis TaxID=1839617 RepID=A0A840VWC0_9ACTN|nr:hypothetical protein [Micromonospora parathelypteridis]MBB5476890.1 hypothetical protein [Micromonospora parathelypteridis]
MNETLAAAVSDHGVLVLALAIAGTTAGFLRAYVAHRTRLHEEREASTRTAARAAWLIRLAEADHDVVRIVERDRDGHREVELSSRDAARRDDIREAA